MELRISKVEKSFNGRKVLKGIDIELKDGDVYLLLGPNASGKSTLLKIVSTVLRPDSGDVLLDGKSTVKHPSIMREVVSYVPEIPALVDEMSVEENLAFFSKLFNTDVDLDSVLEEYGLFSERKKSVSKISKGMRQRVSLAIALMRNPKILVLDEPTSGLDRETVEFILEKISKSAEDGKIVIVSSHDEADLLRVASIFGILEDGKIVFQEETSKIESERLVEIEIDGTRKKIKIKDLLKNVRITRILGLRESLKL